MFTAKEAYEKTMALIEKNVIIKCDDFIESIVRSKIELSIENHCLGCSVDIPTDLKSASNIIQQKLTNLGYICIVNYSYPDYLTISWKL